MQVVNENIVFRSKAPGYVREEREGEKDMKGYEGYEIIISSIFTGDLTMSINLGDACDLPCFELCDQETSA